MSPAGDVAGNIKLMMIRRSILITILIGSVLFSASAQNDSTVFQKKVVGDSLSFRNNVLPRFQDDSLFQSIKNYVSKQQAIVYTITGYPYKKGLVVIVVVDSGGKFIKGISLYNSEKQKGMNPPYTILSQKILRRMNKRNYNPFERWKFESWTLGSTMPSEELIYKIENERVTSAIFLIDVLPGYFSITKMETSFLYQFRDELYNHLFRIK
jgi:AAA+ ATPase superfamily predicted ATPase